MRADTTRLPSDFPAFCDAVRTWLGQATTLDPSLAAVADLVQTMSNTNAEQHLARLAADAADMHGALGASALYSLWSGLDEVV